MRADCKEYRVESTGGFVEKQVLDFVIENDFNAELLDSSDPRTRSNPSNRARGLARRSTR